MKNTADKSDVLAVARCSALNEIREKVMSKKYAYSPAGMASESAPQVEVVDEKQSKKARTIALASAIWTIVCTLYSIVSVCSFVAKGWVDTTFSRVLVVMLVVYVIIFVVLVVLTVKNPEKRKGDVKAYKKTLGIFKAFVNVVYLAISAVSMAGLAWGETSLGQWITFVATFLLAIVQLALKISSFVFKQVRKSVGKKFKVEVQRFSDGKKKSKQATDVVNEHFYK